jgi:hypothetical protein
VAKIPSAASERLTNQYARCRMIGNRDSLDQRESAFDRRSIGRTKISKDALPFFSEKSGVHSCTVRDITNLGAGIRTEQDLKIVPLDFALSFDNFRTVRMCCLQSHCFDIAGISILPVPI